MRRFQVSFVRSAVAVAIATARRLGRALFRYNNSPHYVEAVEDYATNMRVDPRAYYGYYCWQVLYARAGGTVILPVGYPKVKAVTVPASDADLRIGSAQR